MTVRLPIWNTIRCIHFYQRDAAYFFSAVFRRRASVGPRASTFSIPIISTTIGFGDKLHFVDEANKTFRLPEIIDFLNDKGIGFFDTATAVRRLKDNASDKFLEIVEPTDIPALLRQIPQCRVIVTTGEKATRTICETLSLSEVPGVGQYVKIPQSSAITTDIYLYRLPSSSRAYPLSLDKKVNAYRQMFAFAGMID